MYTLGSYTSFIRNGTKNIRYPYAQYSQHWVLGFVYTRSIGVASKSHSGAAPISSLSCPYKDVNYFIQEEIPNRRGPASERQHREYRLLEERGFRGLSPRTGVRFAKLGPEVFEEYWRNYRSGAERTLFVASGVSGLEEGVAASSEGQLW